MNNAWLCHRRVMSRVSNLINWLINKLMAIYGVLLSVSITTSNAPVPVALGLPRIILPEGVVRSSKSPNSVASEINAAVVSKEALSKGDEFVEIPLRLKGLYPPSNV